MSQMKLRLELFVEDLNRSVSFYKDILGFKVIRGSVDDYFALQRGETLIGLGSISGLPQSHYFLPEISNSRKGLELS